jgi:hypothetical protein
LDAQEYAELIRKHLSTCQYLEQKPHFPLRIEIPEDNPNSLLIRDTLHLRGNLRLAVYEQAFFDENGIVERSFAYDFREVGSEKLIWRICNHCVRASIESPCHVHTNPHGQEERNEFFSDSKGTLFFYAMHCVKNHYEHKPQEWEVQKNDQT